MVAKSHASRPHRRHSHPKSCTTIYSCTEYRTIRTGRREYQQPRTRVLMADVHQHADGHGANARRLRRPLLIRRDAAAGAALLPFAFALPRGLRMSQWPWSSSGELA